MVLNKLSIVLGLTLIQFTISFSPQASLAIDRSEVPDPPCFVNDPTGTPLNVRSKPNGRIIAQ